MSCALDETAAPVHSSVNKGATTNPCTVCAPLGAALVTAGVRGAIPLLHGAQGCATYIRRYLISHFREPIDVASSAFGESQTVFGGEHNLNRALDNISKQYSPEFVTVATTCLAETIGEDIPMLLKRYKTARGSSLPVVHASTPSYKDGHVEGFHSMVHAIVRDMADDPGPREEAVNVLPPLVSPADLRHLREITESFGLRTTLLPDYSDTLDGVILDRYRALPSGGTPLNEIKSMIRASRTVDFTLTGKAPRASKVLEDRGVRASLLPLPIGVVATDAFVDVLREVSGRPTAPWLEAERGRLLDAYADGHKYVFGKPIAVYGDPEFVVGMARFLLEIGARPVVCATGARNRALTKGLAELPGFTGEILDDTDFSAIEAACRRARPELMIGSSKGYRVARELGVPLIRIGFPIHDRIGASRVLHLGYRGTTQLFDTLVNALLERKQDSSPIGFSYL